MYIFIILYVLLLDINCKHLENICHLEGFCAPFERRVWELPLGTILGRHVPRWTNSTKDNFSLYKFQKRKEKKDKLGGDFLGKTLNSFVWDINCQHLGNICHLKGLCAPFGRRVEECTFLYMYFYWI